MENARIIWKNSVPESEQYGDVYYSRDGGLQETCHVFLRGNGLPERFAGTNLFTIAETGFGTGLNFLVTAKEFLEKNSPGRLQYYSCEKNPVSPLDMLQAHRPWRGLKELSLELIGSLPYAFEGFHTIHLYDSRVRLTLMYGDAAPVFMKTRAVFDAVYLDGFSPERNPDMWSDELIAAVAGRCRRGTTFSTYTAARAVRQRMEANGFAVRKEKGFGSKREMTVGEMQTGPLPERRMPETAAVIGGGFAGTSMAHSLARRGVSTVIIEKSGSVGSGASGNPAGIFFPQLTVERSAMSRFSLCAFEYLSRSLGQAFPDRRPAGVIQIFADERWQRRLTLGAAGLPANLVRIVDRAEASLLAGTAVRSGGLFFPDGDCVRPQAVCESNAAGAQKRLRTAAGLLEKTSNGWLVKTPQGEPILEAQAVVLCAGPQLREFFQSSWLPVRDVRGQIALMPSSSFRERPRTVVAYDGYTTPEMEAIHVVGSTYNLRDDRTEVDPGMNEELVGFLRLAMPDALHPGARAASGRVAFRSASMDHLPIIGRLCTGGPGGGELYENLYVSGGHASRGLLSCHIGAEIIASEMNGGDFPLESDLVDAVSPARYPARERRKNRPARTEK